MPPKMNLSGSTKRSGDDGLVALLELIIIFIFFFGSLTLIF